VLVVGGGPAGLEAARVAALGGHRVTLAEASPKLGGNIALAARHAPKMHTMGDLTNWLEREVYRLGVEVRTNCYMDAVDVRAAAPDAVIVATGALPRTDGVQSTQPAQPARGADQAHVLSSIDLLTSPRKDWGKTALVHDDGGHYEALAAAEFLIERGVAVTFVTGHPSLAPMLDFISRTDPTLARLRRGDFRLFTRTHLAEIRAGECVLRPLYGDRTDTVPAELVVLGGAWESTRELYDELQADLPSITLVGDALAPRDLQAAVAEGHRAARAIK
jgi:NADPH-dependent 2,4-dienoyl-CoA reductase/sulfur reductase-like enzyme